MYTCYTITLKELWYIIVYKLEKELNTDNHLSTEIHNIFKHAYLIKTQN